MVHPISGHDSQTWTSGQSFSISLDGYAIGSYQFKASFEDTFGNKLVSSITVNIVDQNAPTVTYNIVGFATYNFGELTTFTWTGNDASPSNYSLSLNDEPKINETDWISGIPYDFDLSDVIGGLNKITLKLNDYAGNSGTRYIYFYMVDGEVPVIHEVPNSSIDILENQSSFLVTYNATDDVSPSHYQIWINNVKQGNDITWVNSTDIVIDLVPYLTILGNYNFTIIFYDGAGLSISHQISITVSPVQTSNSNTDTNSNTVESSTISTSPPTSPSSSQPETSSSEKNSDSGENGFLPGFHLPLVFVSFIGLISLYRIQRKHK